MKKLLQILFVCLLFVPGFLEAADYLRLSGFRWAFTDRDKEEINLGFSTRFKRKLTKSEYHYIYYSEILFLVSDKKGQPLGHLVVDAVYSYMTVEGGVLYQYATCTIPSSSYTLVLLGATEVKRRDSFSYSGTREIRDVSDFKWEKVDNGRINNFISQDLNWKPGQQYGSTKCRDAIFIPYYSEEKKLLPEPVAQIEKCLTQLRLTWAKIHLVDPKINAKKVEETSVDTLYDDETFEDPHATPSTSTTSRNTRSTSRRSSNSSSRRSRTQTPSRQEKISSDEEDSYDNSTTASHPIISVEETTPTPSQITTEPTTPKTSSEEITLESPRGYTSLIAKKYKTSKKRCSERIGNEITSNTKNSFTFDLSMIIGEQDGDLLEVALGEQWLLLEKKGNNIIFTCDGNLLASKAIPSTSDPVRITISEIKTVADGNHRIYIYVENERILRQDLGQVNINGFTEFAARFSSSKSNKGALLWWSLYNQAVGPKLLTTPQE